MSTRTVSIVLALLSLSAVSAVAAAAEPPRMNLAVAATPSTSFVSGHESLPAIGDGFDPANSDDKSHGAYGNWPQSGTQWVQYDWTQPIVTGRIEVYWFDDQRGVRLPKACRLKTWDGSALVEVKEAKGLGLQRNRFNVTTFPAVTTTRLRLEMDSDGTFSTGILEWRVIDTGASPNFPPVALAGVDRVVVLPGQTWLSGSVRDDGKPKPAPAVRWSKESGPGEVTFADPAAPETTAKFSAAGAYVLKLTADDGQAAAADILAVTVDEPPPPVHLSQVITTPYKVTGPLWKARLKALMVNWIPHCIRKIEDPKLPEGGIENFVQAGRKLAGAKDARHTGAPFANAWVYNTLESISMALMVDPGDDREIADAQAALKKTLEDWIPKIVGAQEPDGYLQTMYTIQGIRRWSNKSDHEGYNAGYFIGAALAHHALTGGKDTRLYDAARRLADCWCANIGPSPKIRWYEGHEELEQTLMRLAWYVDGQEGPGKGAKYLTLAKYLLDARGGGDEYDQSHLPLARQYEAVGHSVRAVYCYAGLAAVAMEMRDTDYLSAARSLWDSVVNRKYYVTGGVGSGETSEGFGKEYSLPVHAYCESCAGCGEIFFQHKMGLTWQEARYADLAEETLFNAVLGSVDLEGKNFTYTNSLDSGEHRYLWHVCPCCVGNIPRTLLNLPQWMYAKGPDRLYVNLFAGSAVKVDGIAGTSVEVVQTTDYPWKGDVAITLNPAQPKRFALLLRVPTRDTSVLYTGTPAVSGLVSLAVNGEPVTPAIERGYAVLDREWKAGDRIELVLPMKVQRVKASDRIASTHGRVALRYGPLVYNFETADGQPVDGVLAPDTALSAEWRADLLGGVMVIKGAFADGKPLIAIPNYARLNRGGRSVVWIKDR